MRTHTHTHIHTTHTQTHTYTHTHECARTHSCTHILSLILNFCLTRLSLFLSFSFSRPLSLYLSLSLSHFRMHTHSLPLSLSLTHTYRRIRRDHDNLRFHRGQERQTKHLPRLKNLPLEQERNHLRLHSRVVVVEEEEAPGVRLFLKRNHFQLRKFSCNRILGSGLKALEWVGGKGWEKIV